LELWMAGFERTTRRHQARTELDTVYSVLLHVNINDLF
jgi:hypothetical protein